MAKHPVVERREGLGVRSTEKVVEMMKLTKRQIEVTMFACGVEKLEGLKVGKSINSPI
jgi:isopentenyl diphosphate isomerase/L-lactate dehydrogenase-like FMN-dependent dehydrogenase